MRRFALVLMFCALALPVSAARAWVWPAEGPVLRPFSFDRGATEFWVQGINVGVALRY